MKRWVFFAYGLLCYLGFLAIYAYLCAFTGDFLVPKSIDSPVGVQSLATAAAINVALLLGFGLQHSVMARPGFKRFWCRLVPRPIERSTYLLASCVALAVLVWLWQPMDAVVWNVEHPAGRGALWALFGAGWLMVPVVSLMINHFDLFGLRQVWLELLRREYESLPFRTPYLYAHVRHPLYVGWALAFWATPTMTAGHLLYAVVLSGYMAAAALIEERDLIAHFGSRYEEYRQRVPRYLPRIGRARRLTTPKTTPSQLGADLAVMPRTPQSSRSSAEAPTTTAV
jgi:protein-S-isoprenylcysteine O-methyltransferase Ste14